MLNWWQMSPILHLERTTVLNSELASSAEHRHTAFCSQGSLTGDIPEASGHNPVLWALGCPCLGREGGPDEPLWSLPASPLLGKALQWQHPLLTGGQWGWIAYELDCEFLVVATHCSSVLQMLFLGFSPSLVGLCLEWFKTSLFTPSITKERFGNVENMRPLWKRGAGFWRTQAPSPACQMSSSLSNGSSHFCLMPI